MIFKISNSLCGGDWIVVMGGYYPEIICLMVWKLFPNRIVILDCFNVCKMMIYTVEIFNIGNAVSSHRQKIIHQSSHQKQITSFFDPDSMSTRDHRYSNIPSQLLFQSYQLLFKLHIKSSHKCNTLCRECYLEICSFT